jgi:hypothetical protein
MLLSCRKRSFALFFSGGEDESVAREHVGECRPWPQQFREKKALCGLAAAAIVTVHDEAQRPCVIPLKPLVVCDASPGSGTLLSRFMYCTFLGEGVPKHISVLSLILFTAEKQCICHVRTRLCCAYFYLVSNLA